MAQYLPPTEDVPIFDTSLFNQGNTALTYEEALTKFLTFPTAQGTETLLDVNVSGLATFNSGITTNTPITFNIATGIIANISDTGYTSIVKADAYNSVALTGGQLAIGSLAGTTSQGINSVAIGTNAGNNTQQINTVAIGFGAGQNNQTANAVAIGINAGQTTQGQGSVAIGNIAGNASQGINSVAIGRSAGNSGQGDGSVAIGLNAGTGTQRAGCVAIGNNAGNSVQSAGAIAIGLNAGQTSQGANSIAIGNNAGTTQIAGTIALNATGVALTTPNVSTYINPIRSVAGGIGSITNFQPMYYNTTTFELVNASLSTSTKFNGGAVNPIVSGTVYSLGTTASIPVGTFIVNFYCQANITAVVGSYVNNWAVGLSTALPPLTYTGGTGAFQILGSTLTPNIAGVVSGQITTVFQNTVAQTYYFATSLVYSGFVPTIAGSGCFVQYTRIA